MPINSLVKAVENLSSHIQVEVTHEEIRVKGRTYLVKGRLKFLGFRWNPKAREWYYSIPQTDLDGNGFEFFRK